MPLTNEMQLLVERQTPGVLHMAAVDAVHQRTHAPVGRRQKVDLSIGFEINACDLLTLAQIGDGLITQMLSDTIDDPATSAAAIEPEHQPGLFRRAAMHERIHAQRAVQPCQLGGLALEVVKTRPPDQRAITEDPEIIVVGHRAVHMACDRGQCSRNSPQAMMQCIASLTALSQSVLVLEELP